MLIANLPFIARGAFSPDGTRRQLSRRLLRVGLEHRLKRIRHHLFHPREAVADTFEATIQAIRSVPAHFAGLSSLTGNLTAKANWTAQNNLTGAAYSPVSNPSTITKSYNLGTGSANGASGGCDELFSFQQTIAGGGSATINLNTMTNILQQSSIAIVRIKGYMMQLLSATDDTTITTPVASSITVTNIGPVTPSPLDFNNGGSGGTVTMTNTFATGAIATVAVGAGGAGYPPSTNFLATPQQLLGSGGLFSCNTNATGVISGTQFISGSAGLGYANATVPLVPVGQYVVSNGGAHVYFDTSAAGFLAVSSTSLNFKIYNNDSANTATLQFTVFGCTS